MISLPLHGCAPIPLAHYLKALGIFRLVSESEDGDPAATAHWESNVFILNSRFGNTGAPVLLDFFLDDYCPTPILVPWSGGDFFGVRREKPANSFEKTPTSSRVIEAVLSSGSARLEPYRRALRACFKAMDAAGVKTKKDIEGSGGLQRRLKAEMLKCLRSSLPDEALAWMDATSIIEPDFVAFNVLLGGGGGSDGNSHFSDNFMQCLWLTLSAFDFQRQKPVRSIGGATFDSRAALNESLFGIYGSGTKIPELSPVLFDSSKVGGPNQTTGFEAKAGSNPWDFILMLEGSVLFAGALGRKLDEDCEPSARFPFMFQASAVGLGSSFLGESSGRELWLPLWPQPASLAEVRALLAEGRVEKHGRMAKRGTDAFVAAAQLGFDRGVASFQRIGFFKGRIGGDNYFTAIDQGRVASRRNPSVDLLRDADEWISRLASIVTSDKCPAKVRRQFEALEFRIAGLATSRSTESSSRLIAVLSALGATERTLAGSLDWSVKNHIRPLHGLRPEWLKQATDGSVEFRLAQSVAGMRARCGGKILWFREHLEPLRIEGNGKRLWVQWADQTTNDVLWHSGSLVDVFNTILIRRLIRIQQAGVKGWPDWSPRPACLADITEFIEGRIDERLLADLIWGLSLLDWENVRWTDPISTRAGLDSEPEQAGSSYGNEPLVPSSFYSLLRLCFRPVLTGEAQGGIPLVPAILHRAMNGNGKEASILATRRLRASGMAPLVQELPVGGDIARRTAAAMLFPISFQDYRPLERNILKPTNTLPI